MGFGEKLELEIDGIWVGHLDGFENPFGFCFGEIKNSRKRIWRKFRLNLVCDEIF